MKRIAMLIAVALSVSIPAVASAQPSPSGPSQSGPSSDMRAAMMKARDDARTAAFAALSANDRTKVQAIVDQVNAGKLTDLRDAAQQIDAALTPQESKAVVAQAQKLRDAMRQARTSTGGPNAAPPASPPPGAGGPGGPNGGEHGRMMNDAGAVLLQLSVDPQVMRNLRHSENGAPEHP